MSRLVERSDIVDYQTYEDGRDVARERIFEVKRPRRIHLGEHLTFLFENRETLTYQVQEIMRAERIVRESAIVDEIDTFNRMLGGPGYAAIGQFSGKPPSKEEWERSVACLQEVAPQPEAQAPVVGLVIVVGTVAVGAGVEGLDEEPPSHRSVLAARVEAALVGVVAALPSDAGRLEAALRPSGGDLDAPDFLDNLSGKHFRKRPMITMNGNG